MSPAMAIWDETRALFDLPDGVVYLKGNSLGPPLHATPGRVVDTLARWQADLVRAWSTAGWVDWPDRLGDRIAPLIGAAPGSVTVGDTLTIAMFRALSAALAMRPERRVVLTDTGNFPSDLYQAEGLLQGLGRGHRLVRVAPEAVADLLSGDVAALMLTEVDYRTSRRHDMAALTAAAHEAGALAVWDLAHSAGAIAIDVATTGADFAAGCTYKYLNGGPGAPAFLYAAPRHADATPILTGWFGHDRPFDFEPKFRPAPGARGWRIGTPPVIAMAALDAALDAWDRVTPAEVGARAAGLQRRLADGLAAACPTLTLASPHDPATRGSHLAFRHDDAPRIAEALAAQGVILDTRPPDILRLGVAPLYLGEDQIHRAVAAVADILDAAPDRRATG